MKRQAFNPQWITGKTVARVDMHPQRVPFNSFTPSALGPTMHEPIIHFTDGSSIRFHVEEHPDGDDYGVDIVYIKRRGP